jgi:hypothetical protein
VLVQSGTGTIPPASIAVQSASVLASPSVVSVNAGSTNNRSEIRALFIGAGNIAVENVRVRFDLAGDLNGVGGTLTSGTNVVYSNSNGVATSAYVPGTRSSPGNGGLTVRACWSLNDFPANTCPNAALATLDVVDQPFSVSVPGTNNLIEIGPSGLDYVKRYLVQVSDNAGNAKAGVQVSVSLDLVKYYKGEWVVAGDKWDKIERASCDNEDVNRNGVLDQPPGNDEDANGTNALEPQLAGVLVSFVGSNTTNSDGQVVLKITYPQSLASWLQFNLRVTASVSGTESRTSFQGVLPVLADAISDVEVAPAFQLSPYGIQGSSTVLVTNPSNPAQTGLLCVNPN